MSTGLKCVLVEAKSGWFYLLENRLVENIHDWTEHAYVGGSFTTAEEAVDHLRKHHGNPGFYSVEKANAFHDKLLKQSLPTRGPGR